MKQLGEALRLRNHVLSCLEMAARATDPGERRAWLTFVVAGGGSTGVEYAGALGELLGLVCGRDYPELSPGGGGGPGAVAATGAAGLVVGLVVGLVAWLGVGLIAGMSRPGTDSTNPLSPLSSWRGDRVFGLMVGLVVWLRTRSCLGSGPGSCPGPGSGSCPGSGPD